MNGYDTGKSAAFSPERIEEVNTLAVNIDSRLFFAAGYNPKPVKNGCGELLFWIAATNLYGLFEDCSNPFSKSDLLDVFVQHKFMDKMDVKKLRDFRDCVSSARSIFCHNNGGETGYVMKQYNDFLIFLRGLCPCDDAIPPVVSPLYTPEMPCTPELSDELWFAATESLCREADKHMKSIVEAVRLSAQSTQIREITEAWLAAISGRSKNNGIVRYQVLYDTYKRIASESRITASERDARYWVNKKEKEIKQVSCLEEVYNEAINSATRPSTPAETAHKALMLLENRGYVRLSL